MYLLRPRARHHGSPARAPRRAVALVATLGILAAPLTLAMPASALEGPVANDDVAEIDGRGETVTVDVLANDTWDPSTTATVTAVEVVSTDARLGVPLAVDSPPAQGLAYYRRVTDGPEVTPVASVTDGLVTVTFGDYPADVEPSWTRSAVLSYTLTDSVGQSTLGALSVTEHYGGLLVAHDDAYPYGGLDPAAIAWDAHQDPETPFIPPVSLFNDAFGPAELTIERRPSTGDLFADITEADWRGPGSYGEESERTDDRAVVTPYRICSAGDCSNWATSTFTYYAYRGALPVHANSASSAHDYWRGTGAPTEFTFDPVAEGRAAAAAQERPIPSDAIPTLVGPPPAGAIFKTCDNGEFIENGDGTVTHAFTEWPEAHDGASESAEILDTCFFSTEWRDDSGRVVYTTHVALRFVEPYIGFNLVDDRVWVGTGQFLGIPALLNDGLERNAFGRFGFSEDRFIGVPPTGTNEPTILVGDSALGRFTTRRPDGTLFQPTLDHTYRFAYYAGTEPGTETIPYRVCPAYPSREHCATANITLTVAPEVAAEDDRAATDADTPVEVDVLANDVFTDRLPERDAVVTLTGVPDDVDAVVNPDRTVTVTAPDSRAGETVALTYRLTDFTGSDTATLRVTVRDPDALSPDPVAGPDARDDRTEATAGVTTRVGVLANDVFAGDPRVTVVASSVPAGAQATVDARGRVVLTAPRRLAGGTFSLRYRLTDKTGLSDTATVKVSVTPIITVGADRALAVGGPITGPTPSPSVWPVSFALLALLGGAAAVATRRRKEA